MHSLSERLRSITATIAAISVCLIAGTGTIQGLLLHPRVLDSTVDIAAFIARKRLQPVIRPDDDWTLVAGGDVMLSRYVRHVLEQNGMGFPYDDIRGIIQSADIAFANLENPVGRGTPIPFSGFRFRAEPETLDGLKEAGFDVLSIANNHLSDNGRIGIGITIDFLREAGFAFTGAGKNEEEARSPAIIQHGDRRIAFLAYGDPRFSNQVHFAGPRDAGIALADPMQMKLDVKRARENGADVVVISLHAGTEYRETPDAAQQLLLDAAADAGADVVLGHHPHVIQPLEERGDTWIIGSLGNLVFDQMWSEDVRRGMLLQFRFAGNDVRAIEAIPIQLYDYAQARIAEGSERTIALNRLRHPYEEATVIRWTGSGTNAVTSPRAMPLQEERLAGFGVAKILRDNINGNRRGDLYVLSGGSLRVEEDGFPLWESPADWWVQDAFTADIDGDRRRELLLSVWKKSGGEDGKVRNHLLIYGFTDGQLEPLWQSDWLNRPLCEFVTADLDADGRDEVVTLDGAYASDATCTASTVTLWSWNNGSFRNEWQSMPGSYWKLRSERAGSGQQIVVNGGRL